VARLLSLVLAPCLVACAEKRMTEPPPSESPPAPEPRVDAWALARLQMVAETIAPRPAGGGADWDPRVLDAMRRVPRHAFVPDDVVALAHDDRPLPIGHGQTISQPYIVAFMTDLVRPAPGDRVLDVGTGSGYQAAVLAELARDVTSLEIVCALADRARATLTRAGYGRVLVR